MSRRDRWVRGGVLVLAVTSLVLPGSYAAFSSTDHASGSLTTASSFYGADVIADGAAGYWRLDGATVSDSAGSSDGTTIGSVTSVPGATADGDNAVRTTTAGDLLVPWTVSGDASVELSFKVAASVTTAGNGSTWYAASPLVSTSAGGSTGDFGIGLDGAGDLVAGMGTGAGDATIASTGTSFKDGAWHHVVWTRDAASGAMALYADGAAVASGTGGTEPLTARSSLSLGVDPFFSAPLGSIPAPLDVRVDEVATYPTVLAPARVAAHATALASGYVASVTADSPAGFWRLDDSSGPSAAATVGADGTYVGSVTFGIPGAASGDNAVHLVPAVGYLQVPRLVAADFSIEFWFKDAAPVEDGHANWFDGAALVDGDVSGYGHNDFGISIDGSGHLMAGVGNPEMTIHANGANYGDGSWHYVVFTRARSSGAIGLYVDGSLKASNPGTGNTGLLNEAPVLTLGEYSTGTGGSAAVIDELAQYPTVLTAAQVAAHYAQAS